ncbi:MAG TPA: LacI family DNA-binding transcriptional regulator [Verrucomicrobiae bacterium]
MSRPATLKDIAREVGVSVMTVSRALRLDPKVSPALQQKIQLVATDLGYRPNPLVSALMSYRRAGKPEHYDLRLGFVTSFTTRDGWKKHRLYREFFDGVAVGADRHGYHLEDFWLAEPGMTSERMVQILMTRNIPGVVFAPLPEPEGRLHFNCGGFAAVAIGYSIQEPAMHRVSNYQFRSMRLLLHKLAALGYKRPGLALPQSLDDRVLHQWLGGFLVEQPYRSSIRSPSFILPDASWTREKFERWIDRRQPDVVIGQQDELLEWLRASGRRVPEDIGFAHLDCPALNGELSGIYQNGPQIGVAAADMLVGLLHRNERGTPLLPSTLLIEGSWVAGKTVRDR